MRAQPPLIGAGGGGAIGAGVGAGNGGAIGAGDKRGAGGNGGGSITVSGNSY